MPGSIGTLSDDVEKRREFLVGARMMGYELVDLDDPEEIARLRASRPRRYPLQPQQLLIADALNAVYDEYLVEIVRRGSKTTTIFCLLLGRCASRDDYLVTYSAQNGVKGTARLREWKRRLDAIVPPDDLALPPWLRGQRRTSTKHASAVALFGDDYLAVADEPAPTSGRGFRIMMGEVGKGIYFDNGSQFLVLKPDAEAYRGEAGDVSWIDEMQEIDPVDADDLLAGIVPLQDTRGLDEDGDEAAIILSGTAGDDRKGPFWDRVRRMRDGDPDLGGVDFYAPEDTPWETIEDEEAAIALLLTIHPGIGTLTTEEKMRKSWRKLAKPQWAREYLSLWPETFGVRAVPGDQWLAAVAKRKPPIPTRVAFGLAIKPGGSTAAIVAAWRTPSGLACVEVVEHRSGTQWIPERAQDLSRKYRGSTIAYDDIGEAKATAAECARLDGVKPRLRVQTYRENAAGCVQVLRDLERGKLRHLDQTGLNEAVRNASRREVRNNAGVWLWGTVAPGDDITCLDAATRALRNWDQHYATRKSGAGNVMAA